MRRPPLLTSMAAVLFVTWARAQTYAVSFPITEYSASPMRTFSVLSLRHFCERARCAVLGTLPWYDDAPCVFFIIGFVCSLYVGHLAASMSVRAMREFLYKHQKRLYQEGKPVEWPKPPSTQRGSLSLPQGLVERTLYTGALMMGAPQWIGVWLAIKVAAKWKSQTHERGADNIWLIGTGVSLLVAFVGAWIALGRLPSVASK